MSKQETLQIGIRSKRKPGNSWVDNEIAVCYQPIIGADAVWIYHNLAHQVQAQDFQPSVTFALREMASWSGRSKDTVQRCMAILEHVGLVAVRRSTKSKAVYDLLDVKELVVSQGAVYDARRASFVLPSDVTDRLIGEVKSLRGQLGRKMVSPIKSVAQSDRLPIDSLFLSAAQSDRSVALEDASVAPDALVSSYRKEEEKGRISPLPPASGGGVVSKVAEIDRYVELAVDQVMHGCGFVRRRLRRVLRSAIEQRRDVGETPATIALAMIAAWKSQAECRAEGLLLAHFGPEKFFGDGHWNKSESWHWDNQAIERKRGASVGSRRAMY